jgi:hypothetical protein
MFLSVASALDMFLLVSSHSSSVLESNVLQIKMN